MINMIIYVYIEAGWSTAGEPVRLYNQQVALPVKICIEICFYDWYVASQQTLPCEFLN